MAHMKEKAKKKQVLMGQSEAVGNGNHKSWTPKLWCPNVWTRCITGTSWCTEIDGRDQPAPREEEEKESEEARSDLSKEDGGHTDTEDKAASDANGTQRAIQTLLENLHHGCAPMDGSPPAPVDSALDLLHNRAALLMAQERLQSQLKND